ncbi:MAG: AAA family ATPase [Chloroflexi bacterium]|nr:AAA family ATPase [Chloroflexota bacterium]
MWTGFQLRNFKGYQDTGIQELRPYTVLIGPNGGGKSTLLQFLMMLKQTVESTDTATTLITSIEREKGYVDLGQYKDYVYGGRATQPIEMFLRWKPVPLSGRQATLRPETRTAEAQSIRVGLKSRGRSQVSVTRLSYGGGNHTDLITLTRQEKAAYEAQFPAEWNGGELKARRDYGPEKFYRFPPAFLADLPAATETRLRGYVLEFEEIRRSLTHQPGQHLSAVHSRRGPESRGEHC